MPDVSEDELGSLFGLADMNLSAYVDLLDKLVRDHPKMSRRTWLAKLTEVSAGFDPDDLRVLLAVAVLRIREAKDLDG